MADWYRKNEDETVVKLTSEGSTDTGGTGVDLPAGGTEGQVLTIKQEETDSQPRIITWEDAKGEAEFPEGGLEGQVLAIVQEKTDTQEQVLSWIDISGNLVRVMSDPKVLNPMYAPLSQDMVIRIKRPDIRVAKITNYTVQVYKKTNGTGAPQLIETLALNPKDANVFAAVYPVSPIKFSVGDKILFSPQATDALDNKSRPYPKNTGAVAEVTVVDVDERPDIMSNTTNVAGDRAPRGINGIINNDIILFDKDYIVLAGEVDKPKGYGRVFYQIFSYYDEVENKFYALYNVNADENNAEYSDMKKEEWVLFSSNWLRSGVSGNTWNLECEFVPYNPPIPISSGGTYRRPRKNTWVMGRTGDHLYIVSNYGDIVMRDNETGSWELQRERLDVGTIYRANSTSTDAYNSATCEMHLWDGTASISNDVYACNALINGKWKFSIALFHRLSSATTRNMIVYDIDLASDTHIEGENIQYRNTGIVSGSTIDSDKFLATPYQDYILFLSSASGDKKIYMTKDAFATIDSTSINPTDFFNYQKIGGYGSNSSAYFNSITKERFTKIKGVYYRWKRSYDWLNELGPNGEQDVPWQGTQYSFDGINWTDLTLHIRKKGQTRYTYFGGIVQVDENTARYFFAPTSSANNTSGEGLDGFESFLDNRLFYVDVPFGSNGVIQDTVDCSNLQVIPQLSKASTEDKNGIGIGRLIVRRITDNKP